MRARVARGRRSVLAPRAEGRGSMSADRGEQTSFDKPNVLVLMTDQQKATASHLYGNTFCHTPGMARLADEGALFENAFTPQPLCVPTRVSFWTSQFPHSHGSRRNETLMPP